MDFKLEHLLLFVVAIFLLYHLLGGCGCYNRVVDGFSQTWPDIATPTLTRCSGFSPNPSANCKNQLTLSTNQDLLATNQRTINNKIDNLIFIYNGIKGELDGIRDRLHLNQ